MIEARLEASAWGRMCLFGEHQDYLGLPVIAAAVDLCITVSGRPRADKTIAVNLPDVGGCAEYRLGRELKYSNERDYLPAVLNVLRREGIEPECGWDCEVCGTIPIGAGASSSSALVVAFVKFLLAAAGVKTSAEDAAVLANRAEVLEFGEPGGLMDHYISALGGVYYMDFSKKPVYLQRMKAELEGFVLADSGEAKNTTDVLRSVREDAEAAIEWVKEHAPKLDFGKSDRGEFAKVAGKMPEELRRKLEANLANRDLCRQAREMLAEGPAEPDELGRMLSAHQRELAEGIGVSTARLERIMEAAMGAGALGAKLNGSGGGGSIFAYAPGREIEVAAAIEASEPNGEAKIVTIPEGPA